ncbi:hypothetical protein B0H21DRAFT_710917 [Amylocystis lapponica]|nr:hypothetical protein B0H21DRAFT_710917 [Amylocystis lapponica]
MEVVPPDYSERGTDRTVTVNISVEDGDASRERLEKPQAILVEKEEYQLKVVDGPSSFTANSGGLINRDQPLLHYYHKCFLPAVRAAVLTGNPSPSGGDPPPYDHDYEVDQYDNSVRIGGVSVVFERTIRVPDTRTASDLGPFSIYSTENFTDALPESIAENGGIFINPRRRFSLAVKIFVGGINAITGLPRGASPGGQQDHLAVKKEGGQKTVSQPHPVSYVNLSLCLWEKDTRLKGRLQAMRTWEDFKSKCFPSILCRLIFICQLAKP